MSKEVWFFTWMFAAMYASNKDKQYIFKFMVLMILYAIAAGVNNL